MVHERPIDVGDTFELRHVHSVTRRPVVEVFSVDDPTTVALEELRFDAFGPNLPVGPERSGDTTTTFLREGDAYRVLHHGRRIGSVDLRVGSIGVDHVITFADGDQLRLLDAAPAGAHVELRLIAGR